MTLTAAARSRVKSQALPDPRWHTHVVTAITLTAALLLASSCGEDDPVQPVQVKAALQDRSFRQWEISAADYRLEKAGDAKFQDAEFVIHFEDPESAREFPDKCDDCIPDEGFLHLRPECPRRRQDLLQAERSRQPPAFAFSRLRGVDAVSGGRVLRVGPCHYR